MRGSANHRLTARLLVWLGCFAFLAYLVPMTAADADGGPVVWVVDLEGPLGPAAADLVIRAIDDAAAADATALVIRMDTPGGLDKSMRALVQAILAAKVPVVTFVAPEGARAASAGAYIAYASHVAAMAPATNIGSSTPVSISPAAPSPRPSPPTSPAGDEATAPEPLDAMGRKVVNDAVAYLQGIAELRGRNVAWAEETVREGANVRASVAVAEKTVDLMAADLPALLLALDGREVALRDGLVTLETADAGIYRVESDWKHDLLELITDPTIAYGLLIFGIYGLILEFYNPGMIFPSVIGIVCLLLGAYGLQMLPVNYAALALIFVGIGMMVGEVFTPTMGALGIAGVVAFVFGSLMLLDTQSPEFGLPLAVIAAFTVSTAAVMFIAVGAALRARHGPVKTGHQAMLGATVEVIDGFPGEGHVHAFGEIWRAKADVPMSAGTLGRVTEIDGLVLTVTPEASAADAGADGGEEPGAADQKDQDRD
ncbi:MAG: nodulation protein NfeD [Pseudomonadota bacterium]